MENQKVKITPAPTEKALNSKAVQAAYDLDALLKQSELHVWEFELGNKRQCLITSVDSFVAELRPLLTETKAQLQSALAVAMQQIAVEQVNLPVGTDFDIAGPSVTLLNVSDFIELVENGTTGWTCADESVRAAVQSTLDVKRLRFVAPGQCEKHVLLDPKAIGIQELFRNIFGQLASPGAIGTEFVFEFDAKGRLFKAHYGFEDTQQFCADDDNEPIRFRATAMLDVKNLDICSEGTQLCDATLAMASECADTNYLAEKLFDLYFEGCYELHDEPIALPVWGWAQVD